jgi:hypothetical protein
MVFGTVTDDGSCAGERVRGQSLLGLGATGGGRSLAVRTVFASDTGSHALFPRLM